MARRGCRIPEGSGARAIGVVGGSAGNARGIGGDGRHPRGRRLVTEAHHPASPDLDMQQCTNTPLIDHDLMRGAVSRIYARVAEKMQKVIA